MQPQFNLHCCRKVSIHSTKYPSFVLKMIVSVFKLALLFFGFMGYFIEAQQYSKEIHSIANNRGREKRAIIYMNSKAPITLRKFYQTYF